jgi:hypothetical protein
MMARSTTLGVGVILIALLVSLGGLRASPRAAAQQTETVQLFVGCNNVSLTWPSGTTTETVAAAVAPAGALVAIWRFEAAQTRFLGFSPQFPQASDLRTVNRLDAVFLCVNAAGTLGRPALGDGPAPAPTSGNPAETLLGQRAVACNYGVELELVVARVEWTKTVAGATAPGNAMWVVAFLDVTNLSTQAEALYGAGSARVVDERGRQFNWAQYPPDPVDLSRAYGVKGSYEDFAPGITETTVAVFQVPGDVRTLTLEGKRDLC